MAKGKPKKAPKPVNDLPLFALMERMSRAAEDVAPLLVAPTAPPGPGDCDSEIIRLRTCDYFSKGLDAAHAAGKDRQDIAAQIGRLTNQDNYSKLRLDKLAAPSQEQYYPRPAEIIAHCLATGDTSLITYLADRCGLHAVTSKEYALVKLGEVVQAENETDKAKTAILAQVSAAMNLEAAK